MKSAAFAFLLALASISSLHAADNAVLKRLYEEDQADRTDKTLLPFEVGQRDRAREAAALEFLQRGGVITANDHYHAALIFQHSDDVDDTRLAYALAMTASRIDPSHAKARWLSAAAWDRVLQRTGRPQWYGTQFVRDRKTLKWSLYETDASAVTDEERVRLIGRRLSETDALVARMNREGQ